MKRSEGLGPWKLDCTLGLQRPGATPNLRRKTQGTRVLTVRFEPKLILRKEVIQPQVPLRLPCYDFTPVTNHSLGTCLPCGLAQPLLEQSTSMV